MQGRLFRLASVISVLGVVGATGCAKERAFGSAADSDGADRAVGELIPGDAAARPESVGTTQSGSDGSVAGEKEAVAEPECAGLPLSRCECKVGETTTCVARFASLGVCALRMLECVAPGVWPGGGACVPDGPELCDPGQQDENCDGSIDENCSCTNTSAEACGEGGVRICADGAWGACACLGERSVDLDQNGVPDIEETLLQNGNVTTSIDAWTLRVNDPGYGAFVRDDAGSLSCSGALELTTLETGNPDPAAPSPYIWITHFAEQCVQTSNSRVVAYSQARLIANTGDYGATLQSTGVDPSFASVELQGYSNPDCVGDLVIAQDMQFLLETDGAWQTLGTSLQDSVSIQSLRIRWNVVEDGLDGSQVGGVRIVQWDNFMLRAL